MSWKTPAASSGGKASSNRNALTNWAQTKNGSRIQVMPGARSCTIVVIKFTAPSSDDVIKKIMPISQYVCPWVATTTESGGYDVQPELAAPPGATKLASITTPPRK